MSEAPGGGPAREERCLITGASGFIGGRLAERLASEGYPVRALARRSSDTARLASLDVEIVPGDLSDPSSLARAVEGCRHVLHCAALVTDWATTREITRTNVEGTRSLLDAAAGAEVRRFIHLSTTDVYGHPGGPAIDESFRPDGRLHNWYAHTKRQAEEEVRHAQENDRLETVILRPATVYGPGSADVIGEIARAIRAGNMLLVDRGRAVAGLCYVDNLIDGALIALHHEAAPGNAFNVSDGLSVTWRQLTDDLAAGLGCRKTRWSMPYTLANAIGFSLEHGYRLLRSGTGLEHAPAALAPGRPGTGQRPELQQPQAARDPRLGAAGRLPGRAQGNARVAAVRLPFSPHRPLILEPGGGIVAAPAATAESDQQALIHSAAASLRHPLTRTLLALTFTTGLVDGVSYLGIGHVFTANMTGNIVLLGFGIAGSGGLPVLAPLVSLGAFLLGAGAGGLLAKRLAPHHHRHLAYALSIEVALVGAATAFAAAVTIHPNAASGDTLIALLALAMGVRNATVRKIAVPDLTTTVLTMTLTGLAADSPLVGGSGKGSARRTAAVAALLAGALAGGLLLQVSLAVPIAAAGAIALLALLTYRPSS